MTSTLCRRLLAAVVGALAAIAVAGPAAAAVSPAQLLAEYQPVLVFDPAERFRPTTVETFVGDSQLERFTGSGWAVTNPQPTPATLPGPGTGIWRLNQRTCTPAAPLGGLDCYAAAAAGRGAPSTVYGHVAVVGTTTVLQYWLFYYDNVYSYFYPPSLVLWQAHEGDWEAVAVVLGPDGSPREVGYSQHCLGERRSWAATPRLASHPIVFVASGSHANYFSPGVHPFDPRCVPPEAAALLRANGLPLPSDYAGVGDVAWPWGIGRGQRLDVLDERDTWLAFPGFWGELQYFHSPFTGTVPFGTAPVGPAVHSLWRDPLGTLATWTPGP